MKIVGISGKISTGKTTLANHFLAKTGGIWNKRSFADALKDEVAQKFNIPPDWCYNEKNRVVEIYKDAFLGPKLYVAPPSQKMTVREILQWWGTEVCRVQNPDYWDRQMIGHINTVKGCDGIIIDDVRFPSEAKLIQDRGGDIVRLEPFDGWGCDPDAAKHISETALDDYGYFDLSYSPDFGELEWWADRLVFAVNAGKVEGKKWA